MAEFYEGALDTLAERLCNSISSFDKEWIKRCIPATEEQIRQLQDILAEYQYTIPAAYLYFLRRMGQNDGELLENEWDNCESDIDMVLEVLEDREDLEKGLFLFSCNWEYAYFYMKLSSMNDNPIVTGIAGAYVAENFEKYLFHRAFHMYQKSFVHSTLQNPICYEEKKEKEDCKMCPLYKNTTGERMDFILRMADTYGLKKAWFSDQMHFFYYCSNYALEINVGDGYKVIFCCDDDKLFEQIRFSPIPFPEFFLRLSEHGV